MDYSNDSATCKTIQIPSTILIDRALAVLESITEYLKDEKKLSYHEIATILNRDDRTIWTVHHRSKKKREVREARVSSKDPKINLPSSIFRDRTLAVLEAIVEYLKETKGLTYHEIAEILNRNDRTVWTVYRRAKIKRGEHEQAN